MFELKMTGFITIGSNKQLIDGQTDNSFYTGIVSNGKQKIKIQPTYSQPITKNALSVFEIVEGSVSNNDIGTIFREIMI